MKNISVANKTIGRNAATFVIAEIGINHNGDLATAQRLIEAAKQSGADAVKFQTYITEKRVPKDSPIYGILKQCELGEADFRKLKATTEDLDVLFFSTPFDAESVALLDELGTLLYKVASFDLTNLSLLRALATARKPVLMSRGMADRNEIDTAVAIFEEQEIPYALLHCISAYPTQPEQANLNVIRTLLNTYPCPVGYSDHTLGVEVPVLAVAAGARLIEKHFTLDRAMAGPDHTLSADPDGMAEMVSRIRETERILGEEELKTYEAEKGTLIYRRGSK